MDKWVLPLNSCSICQADFCDRFSQVLGTLGSKDVRVRIDRVSVDISNSVGSTSGNRRTRTFLAISVSQRLVAKIIRQIFMIRK